MPNQSSFDVLFTKDDIMKLLETPDAANLGVSGSYTYKGDGYWEMSAIATVCNANYEPISSVSAKADCIKPCPGRGIS